MTDELQALLANLPELKVVQHCLAGGGNPVDTVKLDPIQRRALGSMERKHGETIVAAVNWCRTERPALIAERDALRDALENVSLIWGEQEEGNRGGDWEDAADDMHNIAVAALAGQP